MTETQHPVWHDYPRSEGWYWLKRRSDNACVLACYCRGAWLVSDEIGRTRYRSPWHVQRLFVLVKAVPSPDGPADISEIANAAVQEMEAVAKAFGAPGDYGYSTKEGQALFSLAKARVALAQAVEESEKGRGA